MEREVVYLTRDCFGLMIPSGARIMLHQGTEVTITQNLGNSFTVNVFGNLARIDGQDADALGKELVNPLEQLATDASIEEQVWAQLKTVFDPEIPVNIVDLGLVYRCEINESTEQEQKYHVYIEMTLTAPGCGMGPVIAEDAKQKILSISQVSTAQIEIVFDPPWDREMMSDVAKLTLGMF